MTRVQVTVFDLSLIAEFLVSEKNLLCWMAMLFTLFRTELLYVLRNGSDTLLLLMAVTPELDQF